MFSAVENALTPSSAFYCHMGRQISPSGFCHVFHSDAQEQNNATKRKEKFSRGCLGCLLGNVRSSIQVIGADFYKTST